MKTEHDDLFKEWTEELKKGSENYRGVSLTHKDCKELLGLFERVRCGHANMNGLRCTLIAGHEGPHVAVTRWKE